MCQFRNIPELVLPERLWKKYNIHIFKIDFKLNNIIFIRYINISTGKLKA